MQRSQSAPNTTEHVEYSGGEEDTSSELSSLSPLTPLTFDLPTFGRFASVRNGVTASLSGTLNIDWSNQQELESIMMCCNFGTGGTSPSSTALLALSYYRFTLPLALDERVDHIGDDIDTFIIRDRSTRSVHVWSREEHVQWGVIEALRKACVWDRTNFGVLSRCDARFYQHGANGSLWRALDASLRW